MTLRETLQGQVNVLQARIDGLKSQLDKQSPDIESLMNTDTDTLLAFFKIFKDELGL